MDVKVCIAGHFDPLHIGHVRHIREARKLGSYLIVILNPDTHCFRKKGYVFLPQEQRKEIMENIKGVDEVVMAIDDDGTVAKTLEMIKKRHPDGEMIFAKGGDRTPDNMPRNEIETCQRIGYKIVYNIGDALESSSKLVENIVEFFKKK